jgi:hypothetical protein
MGRTSGCWRSRFARSRGETVIPGVIANHEHLSLYAVDRWFDELEAVTLHVQLRPEARGLIGELLEQAVVIGVRTDPEPEYLVWVTLETHSAPGTAYAHGVDRIGWMDPFELQAGVVGIPAPKLVGGESLALDRSRKLAETFSKGSGRA